MRKVAILLLGHGSRAPEANEAMYRVLETLREQGEYKIVEPGFMQLNPPSIEDGAAACVAQGADTVLMVPYFLHLGIHIQEDLPEKVRILEELHPGVHFKLGSPLGFHLGLVDAVRDRIAECKAAAESDSQHQLGASGGLTA